MFCHSRAVDFTYDEKEYCDICIPDKFLKSRDIRSYGYLDIEVGKTRYVAWKEVTCACGKSYKVSADGDKIHIAAENILEAIEWRKKCMTCYAKAYNRI
jgi:hypothetical protein